MNVHKNARLTPRGREVLVSRLEDGRVTVQEEGTPQGALAGAGGARLLRLPRGPDHCGVPRRLPVRRRAGLAADAPAAQPQPPYDRGEARETGGPMAPPRWLPEARILHPWPAQRFDAGHPRQAPAGSQRTPGSVRGAPGNPRPYRDRLLA